MDHTDPSSYPNFPRAPHRRHLHREAPAADQAGGGGGAARLTATVQLDPAFVAEGLAIKPAARTLLEAVIRMHTATSLPSETNPPPHDPEDDACCHECPVCAIRRKVRCAERLVAELDRELVLC